MKGADEDYVRSITPRVLEPEGRLDDATKSSKVVIWLIASRVKDAGSNGDIIGDLILVKELPDITIRLILFAVSTNQIGGKGGLTKGEARRITLREHIAPLEAHHPGLHIQARSHTPPLGGG